MPEDKKNQKRHDAKDQRKPRRGRHQETQIKKSDKANETKEVVKVTAPEKPAFESPGPEFYKNLKRETDEIIKITEEETNKYKKKEIQSNWAKYEMPIDSYNEIEEQENLGADYEQLIQAPLSVGGHFQFKHEKSWDASTGPSPYDKYFDINMEHLCLAISTIPFYERNSIDIAAFNESDILSMNNRATRFKQKYFNDKSYTTPEIEAQEKILKHLRDDTSNASEIKIQENILQNLKDNFDKEDDDNKEKPLESEEESINFDTKEKGNKFVKEETCNKFSKEENGNKVEKETNKLRKEETDNKFMKEVNEDIDVDIKKTVKSQDVTSENFLLNKENNLIEDNSLNAKFDENQDFIFEKPTAEPVIKETKDKTTEITEVNSTPKGDDKQKETKKPVIESPEDLEKWLDDYLDS